MLGNLDYWEEWMGKHDADGDRQTADLGLMFSKHNQNVQRLVNRSTAIQKLPYLLGHNPKCEVIAVQFITSCYKVRAANGNCQMFYNAT